ncbi:MAG TPA: SCP2 sterol-binding domain-containing protein [Burkholderiaceae bacterium]|nr:SCP2 sterol-binding domain-containing protein [Burkholderiaceae bacterium]
MFPIPSFLAPAAVGARVLNALLAREDWARERLARHAGKTVRFVVGHMTVGLVIASDGSVSAGNPSVVPDVTLTIPPERLSELPQALRSSDSERIAGLMHIQGDAALAHGVAGLAHDLRWDVENDLSRLVGDVAARRLVSAFRGLAVGARRGTHRLAANLGEYLAEESAFLSGRDAYVDWAAGVRAAGARLDALENRVARLSRPGPHPGHKGGR